MRLRPMIIGSEEKEKLQALLLYARNNVIEFKDLVLGTPLGADPQRNVEIPHEYRIVLSYEKQQEPLGMCRHMSITVPGKENAPNQYSVHMVAEELGFRNNMVDTFEYYKTKKTIDVGEELLEGRVYMYTEITTDNRIEINVMEKVLDDE